MKTKAKGNFLRRKRINISLDPALHAKAKQHARKVRYTDFSGLVTSLLIEDIARTTPQEAPPQLAKDTMTDMFIVPAGKRPVLTSKQVKAMLNDFP